MRPLTLKDLVRKNACENQLDLFMHRFGRVATLHYGMDLSLADGFDIGWAVGELLSAKARAYYIAMMKPAMRARYAVLSEFDTQMEAAKRPHVDAYKAVAAPYDVAYQLAIQPFEDAFTEAVMEFNRTHPREDLLIDDNALRYQFGTSVGPAREALSKARHAALDDFHAGTRAARMALESACEWPEKEYTHKCRAMNDAFNLCQVAAFIEAYLTDVPEADHG